METGDWGLGTGGQGDKGTRGQGDKGNFSLKTQNSKLKTYPVPSPDFIENSQKYLDIILVKITIIRVIKVN
jgi:hypothetical protein